MITTQQHLPRTHQPTVLTNGSFDFRAGEVMGAELRRGAAVLPPWENPDLIPQSAVDKVDQIELAYLRSWKVRVAVAA